MISPGAIAPGFAPFHGRSSTAPSATGAAVVGSPGPVGAHHALPSQLARLASIEQTLRRDGVPVQDIHLPNLLAADPLRKGVVAPTYQEAPAPMGVADLGLENLSGSTVPYVLNTTSVEGIAAFTTAESAYLDGDGPDTFGVQLNAVATNVTILGVHSYEFWAQNFLSYTVSTHTLSLGDNLWNLSDASGNISANALYSHGPNGTLLAPIYYYAIGPTYTVKFPFTVTFYLNASLVADRPAIFFNYSVASPDLNATGSFDNVVFNSAAATPVTPAAVPAFQANGTGVDPFGLPNDLELVLVGNGNGDTTTFFALHAGFTLSTWSAQMHGYRSVPSAIDFGSDTGETSDGIAVTYTASTVTTPAPTASLTIGPSFLYGLWNESGTPGLRAFSVRQTPANAFLFVNPGTAFNAGEAQWAPTETFVTGARSNFTIPATGSYFFEWMLSDYTPRGGSYNPVVNTTTRFTLTLTASSGEGVYTPLLAWGNSELKSIASGAGTAASPYVLHRNQLGQIDAVFGAINVFFFPVFPGILLINTTAIVHVIPPSLSISYLPSVAGTLSNASLPTTNNLQVQLWNVTNVTLENAPVITGWLSSNVGYSAAGEVTVWGSHQNLIAGNTFYDQGIALALYGGTANTVWGNSFLNSTAAATKASALENGGNNTTGIFEAESGDLVYNNYFALPAPAYTATTDPFSCQVQCRSATYTDHWNVTYAAASAFRTVLGRNLTGSIIGTTYQGGNYWSNYGTPSNPLGRLPYNDSGLITVGGDYWPLVRSAVYPVTVHEVGLLAGTVWGVAALGVVSETNGSLLTLYSPNGTYPYTVTVPVGYSGPAGGNFTVTGAGIELTLTFVPLVPVQFNETGLVPGSLWNVTFNATIPKYNVTESSSSGTMVFDVAPGDYTFVASAYGYNVTPNDEVIPVASSGVAPVLVTFSLAAVLTINTTGLPGGTAWTTMIGSTQGFQNFSTLSPNLSLSVFEIPGGPYTWNVTAAGYNATPSNGSGDSPGSTIVAVVFSPINGTLAISINVRTAELWVNDNYVHSPNGSFSTTLLPGIYSVIVIASGYVTYYNNVSVTSGNTTALAVVLTAVPTVPATGPLGIPWLGWALIGALLAVVALLGVALLFRRRKPPTPAPVTPYAGTTAAAPPRIPAPWEEGPADRAEEPPTLGSSPPPS